MKKSVSRTLGWFAAAAALVGAGYLAGSRSTPAPEASVPSHSRAVSGPVATAPASAAVSGGSRAVEPPRDSDALPFAALQPPVPAQPVVTDVPPEFLATGIPRRAAFTRSSVTSAAGFPAIPEPRQVSSQQPARVLSYAVDPSAPGNSMTHAGMKVAVDERLRTDSDSAEALGVSITPQADSPDAAVADSEDAVSSRDRRGRSNADTRAGDAPDEAVSRFPDGTPLTPHPGLGLTPEEELFRTKWGWLAFDQARTAAKQEASNR